MTFAHFQTPGNTPSVKDLLIKPVRIGAIRSEAPFNKRALSLSSPTALSQGPEEMCLSLEHQNPSKTSEKMGYFDLVTVSLHILYTANQETEGL